MPRRRFWYVSNKDSIRHFLFSKYWRLLDKHLFKILGNIFASLFARQKRNLTCSRMQVAPELVREHL